MVKKFFLVLIIFLCLGIGFFIFINKSNKDKNIIENEENSSTKYGISGYVPTSYPDSSILEIVNYWKDVNKYSQIYGIHVNWSDLDTIKKLSKNYKGDIYVLLGFQNPDDWKNTDKVKGNIDEIIKIKNVKYIGVGNEINLINKTFPKNFGDFKTQFIDINKYIDEKYPNVKTFTTFQYDSLIGKAKLMNIESKSEINIVKDFEEYVDFVGFTVYPFLQNKSVSRIPSEYFTEMQNSTVKPIAITETSWPTKKIEDKSYKFDEEEQKKYYEMLKEVNSKTKFLFVNTIFFNDLTDWRNGRKSQNELFDSLGIRFNNGDEKASFSVWNSLLPSNQ